MLLVTLAGRPLTVDPSDLMGWDPQLLQGIDDPGGESLAVVEGSGEVGHSHIE